MGVVKNTTLIGCWVQVMQRGPYNGKKIFPTHYETTTTRLNDWTNTEWVHAFILRLIGPGNILFPSGLLLFSFGEPVGTVALVSCSYQTYLEHDVVFSFCSPSAWRLNVHSEILFQITIIFELLLLFYHIEPVWFHYGILTTALVTDRKVLAMDID